jgi:hypothetical protein
MRKLHEILGKKPTKGDFGIEIEVEGTDKQVEDPRWKSEHDGSLRGRSCEYVLSKPLALEDIRPALMSLANELKNEDLIFSFRTSVHVHVNVQQLNQLQLCNMIYTYLLLEEPFLTYCGKERKGNRFCLRLQDAEGLLDTLTPIFKLREDALYEFPVDGVRYAAINLGAIQNYGSLEFRAMRGNLDVDNIGTWVEALSAVRDFACEVDNPDAIFRMYMDMGPREFINLVLKEAAEAFAYPKMVQDMNRSCSLSLDLPMTFSQYAVKPKEEVFVDAPVKKVVRRRADAPMFAFNPLAELPVIHHDFEEDDD